MMIKPVSGKVLKYEMISFKFMFHKFFLKCQRAKVAPLVVVLK